MEERTTKDKIELAIAAEISKQSGRADSAPICQGPLFDLLGYSANTYTAKQILKGTFVPPPGTDGPTLIILAEIACIWKKMGAGEVEITVTTEDYQYYWNKVKKKISSSISGLHFGHYKATAHSDFLSQRLVMKLELTTRTGLAPERWARGLLVMLKKSGRRGADHKIMGNPPDGSRLQPAQQTDLRPPNVGAGKRTRHDTRQNNEHKRQNGQ